MLHRVAKSITPTLAETLDITGIAKVLTKYSKLKGQICHNASKWESSSMALAFYEEVWCLN